MAFNFNETDLLRASAENFGVDLYYKKFIEKYGHEESTVKCPFCEMNVRAFNAKQQRYPDGSYYILKICPACLWFRHFWYYNGEGHETVEHIYASDQDDRKRVDELPLARLCDHLSRRWSDRRFTTPKQAQDIVAEIFSEHLHCEVIYLTDGVYSPDGGIDFVLIETEQGVESAFQVKRRMTDKAEPVYAVREFLGSLAMSRFKKGYFVTFAPQFTRAVADEISATQKTLADRDLSITLVDGRHLETLVRKFKAKSLPGHALLAKKGEAQWIKVSGWREIPLGISIYEADDQEFGAEYDLSDLLTRFAH